MKRIISLALIFLVLLSSVSTGLVFAADEAKAPTKASSDGDGTEDNPYIISDFESFEDYLLKDNKFSSTTYFKLIADINAGHKTVAGGYNVENISVDGGGYTISGLNLEDKPLFGIISSSVIRFLNFEDCEAVFNSNSASGSAYFASEIGKNSFITSCRFSNVEVKVGETVKPCISTVAVKNSGFITNCAVKDCTLSSNATEATVGSIAAVNNSSGFIVNSVSSPIYNISQGTDGIDKYVIGSITGNNLGTVKNCYSSAVPFHSSQSVIYPTGHQSGKCEYAFYLKDGDVSVVGGNIKKTAYLAENYTLAALLTEKAFSEYNSNLTSKYNISDYACAWTVKDGHPDLSYDGKTAFVSLAPSATLKKSDLSFSLTSDKSGTYFSEYGEYIVKVGEYDSEGNYTRCRATIKFTPEDSGTMVKNFVLNANYSCCYKMVDVFDNDSTNYSPQYIEAAHNGSLNEGSFLICPYPHNVGLSSTGSEDDELISYRFKGSGTESDPFLIQNEYELECLAHHVNNEVTYTLTDLSSESNVFNYNEAHYLLTNDIELTDKHTPIGVKISSAETAFSGFFDGGGHTVSNLTIDGGKPQSGLFGYVKGVKSGVNYKYAEIRNLNVNGVSISGAGGTENDIKGAIIGQAQYVTVSGCTAKGEISGNSMIAGIIGYAYRCSVNNCGAVVEITTNYSFAWAGGIIGHAQYSDVNNCYANAEFITNNIVDENRVSIGGIFGFLTATTFDNCSYVHKSNINFQNSKDIDGLTGVYESNIKNDEFLYSLIEYSERKKYPTHWGKGTDSYPQIFSADKATYNVITTTTYSGTFDYVIAYVSSGKTATAGSEIVLKSPSAGIYLTDLNNNILDIEIENDGAYYIFTMPQCSVKAHPLEEGNSYSLEGYGTEESPYLIYNLREFKLVIDATNSVNSYYRGAYYKLCNDIDCNGETLSSISTQYSFYGTIDGNGYSLMNASFDSSIISNMSGTLKNIKLKNITNVYRMLNSTSLLFNVVSGNSYVYNVSVEDCYLGGGRLIADSLKSDIRIYNCVFDSIKSQNSYISLFSIGKGNVYASKLIFADFKGIDTVYCCSQAQSIYFTLQKCYFDSALELGSSDLLGIEGDNYFRASSDELKALRFIYDFSKLEETNNKFTSMKACTWGQNKNTLNPELSIFDSSDNVYKINYDFKFDNSLMFVPEDLPNYSVEGNLVELEFDSDYSASSIKIKCNEVPISYNVTDSDKDGYILLRFIMPNGDITVSSDSVYPPIRVLEGHGTENDPYKIYDIDDLLHFSGVINQYITADHSDIGESYEDYRDAHFELMADIKLNNLNWISIGETEDTRFCGTFDGNNHKLYGSLKLLSSRSVGLFNYVNGTIENLSLAITFDCPNAVYIGSVAVNLMNGKLKNIYSECAIETSPYASYVGGLVAIAGNSAYSDGIVIERCVAKNTYSVHKNNNGFFGGIVGYADNGTQKILINNCAGINSLDDQFVACTAGFVSKFASASNITLSNSYLYNLGVSYDWDIAPNLGNNNIDNCYTLNSNISNIAATKATKDEFFQGKIAYLLNRGCVDGSQAWYQNLDNGIAEDDYPLIFNNNSNTVYKVDRFDRIYSNFNYNEDGIYEIGNPYELMQFSSLVNNGEFDAKAIVVADIDMTGFNTFVPIGQTGLYYNADPTEDENRGYSGDFNGQGHIISNLTINGSEAKELSYGLFGTVSGTVKNIAVEKLTYVGAGKDSRVGGIAGQIILGGSVTDCYLNCGDINTLVNTTDGVVGGIAGANYGGIIKNCYTYGLKAFSDRFGGIVGDNYGDANDADGTDRAGTVELCYTDSEALCARGTGTNSRWNISEVIFKSGEITYLLGGENDDLWMQGSDKLPSFKGKPIFKNLCEGDVFYSTVDGDFEEHDIDCLRCKNCNNFDAATLVTKQNFSSLGLDESFVGMYAVKSASNMYWFSERDAFENLTGGIVLMNDVSINTVYEPWTPINVNGNFKFDGRDFTLELNINFGEETQDANLGLFGEYNYAHVRNLILKGNVFGNTTTYMGGFAATAYRTYFRRVISYANVTNACQTGGYVGGFVGHFGGRYNGDLRALIEYCAVYADVTGHTAGGFIGYGWDGYEYYNIFFCAYIGDVTGYDVAGAIVGYHSTDQHCMCNFTGVYWNEKDNIKFYGKRDTSACQVYIDTMPKSFEEFASGEVTHLMNAWKDVWKQNIDIEPLDPYPIFDAATVYYNTLCDGEFVSYSNTYIPYEHNYNDFHVCKRCIGLRPGELAGIYGFNAELGGNISLNYYMVLNSYVFSYQPAKMVFTVPDTGSSYTLELVIDRNQKTDKFYVFTCEVAAKEITSDIVCRVINDRGDTSDTFHYSIKKYAEQILSNPDVYGDAIPLVKSMLNYGAYAQKYFNYRTDNLANTSEYITEEEKLLKDVDLSSYAYKLEGEQKGVTYDSSSLLLKSETSIKHYFNFKNPEDIENLTITVDGKPTVPTQNIDYYNIKVSDIPAHKLQNMYVVQVGDLYLSYGVFSYGYIALNYSENEALKDTVRALYAYNQEAVKYHNKYNK